MAKKTTSKKTAKKATPSKSSEAKKKSGVSEKKIPAVPKTSPSKKTVLSPALKAAIKELNSLLTELDENEIGFLIQQAGVLIHNKKIVSNPADRERRESQFQKKMNEWKEAKEEMMERVSVEEGDEGKHFILIMGNYRNFFARDEMKRVVKLCHAADDAKDAGQRLFNWFERNRSDVLKNSGIKSPSDQSLQKIYEVIISTYTTR